MELVAQHPALGKEFGYSQVSGCRETPKPTPTAFHCFLNRAPGYFSHNKGRRYSIGKPKAPLVEADVGGKAIV